MSIIRRSLSVYLLSLFVCGAYAAITPEKAEVQQVRFSYGDFSHSEYKRLEQSRNYSLSVLKRALINLDSSLLDQAISLKFPDAKERLQDFRQKLEVLISEGDKYVVAAQTKENRNDKYLIQYRSSGDFSDCISHFAAGGYTDKFVGNSIFICSISFSSNQNMLTLTRTIIHEITHAALKTSECEAVYLTDLSFLFAGLYPLPDGYSKRCDLNFQNHLVRTFLSDSSENLENISFGLDKTILTANGHDSGDKFFYSTTKNMNNNFEYCSLEIFKDYLASSSVFSAQAVSFPAKNKMIILLADGKSKISCRLKRWQLEEEAKNAINLGQIVSYFGTLFIID